MTTILESSWPAGVRAGGTSRPESPVPDSTGAKPGPLPNIAGRYQVVDVISERRRSTAFRAIERESQEARFVKLAGQSARDELAAQKAFRHEPAMLRRLERDLGPGVVLPVVEQGYWEGRPYFVQPWLEGRSLAALMKQRIPLAADATMQVIERNLRVLESIHSAGVVHGDVSPENILVAVHELPRDQRHVRADFRVELVDYETARRIDGPENQREGFIVGKPPYMAPEVARGEPLSPQTDLFALGVVFYEMLTGERPFEARSIDEVVARGERAVPPIALELEVPMLVEEMVRRLLEPKSQRRTPTAAEALRRLAQLKELHGWMSRARPPTIMGRSRAERASSQRRSPAGRAHATSEEGLAVPSGAAEHQLPTGSSTGSDSWIHPESICGDEPATGSFAPSESHAHAHGVDRPGTPDAGTPPLERNFDETLFPPDPAIPSRTEHESPSDSGLSTPSYVAPEPARGEVRPIDENVQFSVFRPRAVRPEAWYPLLAFAHLADRPLDAPAQEPAPAEQVRQQAEQVLGSVFPDYQHVTQDSRRGIRHADELSFVPQIDGIVFNPLRRAFRWEEPVHREEFRFKAPLELDGRTARGSLLVFWESIVVADIPLAIFVTSDLQKLDPASQPPIRDVARPYRKIFASYSHKDLAIVQQFDRFMQVMGDRYVRDWSDLRAGEIWSEKLRELIDQADVFQLFWSNNSMRSAFVREEWEYALALKRPFFIRPSYWEVPFPQSENPALPPAGLKDLHFHRIEVPDVSTWQRTHSADSLAGPQSEGARTLSDDAQEELRGDAQVVPYEPVQQIARGGIGAVSLARHRATGQKVVIKELRFSPAVTRALFEEVPAFAAWRDVQIIRVIDAFNKNDDLFLVREFVEGVDMESWRIDRKELDPEEAVALVVSLAGVLDRAHERGFIHRDLKPGNVLIDAERTVLLWADHLVRAPDGPYLSLVLNGGPCGTPEYMAPERIEPSPKRHDVAADIYAMGVILYVLLTGRSPFSRKPDGIAHLLRQIIANDPPALRSIVPDLPGELEAICLKCLAKDSASRYATASDLADALNRWSASGERVSG